MDPPRPPRKYTHRLYIISDEDYESSDDHMFMYYHQDMDVHHIPDNVIQNISLFDRDTVIWHCDPECYNNIMKNDSEKRKFNEKYGHTFDNPALDEPCFILYNYPLYKHLIYMLFPCPECVLNDITLHNVRATFEDFLPEFNETTANNPNDIRIFSYISLPNLFKKFHL